jgi:uncharacterized membrane protein
MRGRAGLSERRIAEMKKIAEFLKATALGGLFVLLPVLLLYMFLAEALELIVALATPIADLFPKGTFDQINAPVLIALVLLVGVSFLMGLALLSGVGRAIGHWIERTVLERLPMYNVFKSLTTGFAEVREGAAFRPAMLISTEGDRELAYVIEGHSDERVTVLLPRAPAAFSGPVKIVSRDRIEVLDAKLGDYVKVLSQWGVGLRDILGR